MKKIYLINTSEYPTKGTHYLMSMKFVNGFSLYGLEAYDLKNFEEIEDSEDQIFLMCDNFYDQRSSNWMEYFDYLANKFQKTTWIFWTFHNVLNNHYKEKDFPFKKDLSKKTNTLVLSVRGRQRTTNGRYLIAMSLRKSSFSSLLTWLQRSVFVSMEANMMTESNSAFTAMNMLPTGHICLVLCVWSKMYPYLNLLGSMICMIILC